MSMKRNKFLLNEYSAAAGVFILLGNVADGQVVYVDLEPDIIYNFGEVDFDLDNNGTNDLIIEKEYLGSISYPFNNYFSTIEWVVGTSNLSNSIVGIPTSIAFTLNYGHHINESLFFNDGFFSMAGKRRELSNSSNHYPIGPWFYAPGLWNEIPGEDRYLGIKFIDEEDCIHFGWMRCSFTDSVETIHIKDYAYNTECGKGLYAGELISGLDEVNNDLGAIVYSFNKIIYLHLNKITGMQLIISDITGKELIKEELQIESDKIDMQNYPAGLYFVTIIFDGKRFVKKVMIE